MALRTNRGFTLVELLAIIAIIALLAALLTPSFGRALALARRRTCATNVRDIVRACAVYADALREHRGTTVQALPSSGPTDAVGNRQCMWLLVQYDYASPKVFNCPAMRDHTPARKDADPPGFGRDNCSYSFISMVDRGSAGAAPVLTMDNAPNAMVIVGDLNPRWVEAAGAFDTALNGKNSASHGRLRGVNEGQNIGRLDGSATWTTSPAVVTGSNNDDWIYQPTSGAGGTSGQAEGAEDVFLIP